MYIEQVSFYPGINMSTPRLTAFIGPTRVAAGTAEELIAALAPLGAHPEGLLVFSDRTGQPTDLNLSGTCAPERAPQGFRPDGSRSRGRPKLGVKAREVTLLPRHWAWLAGQRGGASASLRRLVEAAMGAEAPKPGSADAAYAFLTAIAGDLPGYEAVIRALFAGDGDGATAGMADWPGDIRAYAADLAGLT